MFFTQRHHFKDKDGVQSSGSLCIGELRYKKHNTEIQKDIGLIKRRSVRWRLADSALSWSEARAGGPVWAIRYSSCESELDLNCIIHHQLLMAFIKPSSTATMQV